MLSRIWRSTQVSQRIFSGLRRSGGGSSLITAPYPAAPGVWGCPPEKLRCPAVADPTLVLLAAGMGSRFGGPKQIAAIGPGGSALIDYAARDAVAAGFGRLVLIVRSEIIEPVERHVAAHWPAEIRPENFRRDLETAAGPAGAAGR